eukprot:g36894.t1
MVTDKIPDALFMAYRNTQQNLRKILLSMQGKKRVKKVTDNIPDALFMAYRNTQQNLRKILLQGKKGNG